MREFNTAVQEKVEGAEERDERMAFMVDGVEYKAYPPDPAQVALVLASISRHSGTAERVAGIINFFVEVLDEPSHTALVARLMDREDPFGLPQVEAIMTWLVEEWSGRPTESPSGSTQ